MILRKKRLNVLNSQKIFNLEVRDMPQGVKLVRDEDKQGLYDKLSKYLEEQSKELIVEKLDDYYLIEYQEGDDLNLYQVLISTVDKFTVKTSVPLPLILLDLLAGSPKIVDVVYTLSALEQPNIVDNAIQAYAGTKVSILFETTQHYSSLRIRELLYKVKFNVNELVIRWEDDNYENEYEFFNTLRNPLSGWGIVIVIESKNKKEADYLLKRKAKDSSIKQSYRVWGR